MKITAKLSLLIAVFILLSSCSIKTTELSDRLIAEAIGIDTDKNGFCFCVQALDTGISGSGEGVSSGERTRIYTFYGQSTGEALELAKTANGLSPLYSHARVLIIGKETAERHLWEILDFFLREYTTRSDILIAVAEKSAAEIINADLTDGTTDAAAIENAIETGNKNGTNTLMPLYKFINLMLSENDTAYCPVLSVKESEYSKKQELLTENTAIFDNKKLIFTVNSDLTEGLLLLNGDSDKAIFSIAGDNGIYTLGTIKKRTKIKPSYSDGKMNFIISEDIVCDITEYASKKSKTISADETKAVEQKLKDYIEEKEKRTLETIFVKNGCDICRFNRITLRKYPKFYDEYVKNMPGLTNFEFEINATVRRTGREMLKSD